MKKVSILSLAVMLPFLISCGISESEYEKVKSENEKLKVELDECMNGADRLISKVEKSYKENNLIEAKRNIELLYQNHPESPKNKEFSILVKEIDQKIIAEKKRKAEEEKERIRLENLNNTGMWSIRFYVDEFGEPTKQGYITNTDKINGLFSNTATQNSRLTVDFLINNSSVISIQLYEYAGNNPVKAISSDRYRVLVQDKDGDRLSLGARNYSDRLSLDEKDSKKIHNALMKGGTIKFRIYDVETPTTQYEFSLKNADCYENAYTKLMDN